MADIDTIAPRVRQLTDIFRSFAAAKGVSTAEQVKAREQSAFESELQCVGDELRCVSTRAVVGANGRQSLATIPPFYLERTNPTCATAREALQDAARTREVAARFEILNYWDNEALLHLQSLLTSDVEVPGGKLPLPAFNRVVKQMERWRESHDHQLAPGLREVADQCGFSIPELNVRIFLACAQDATQSVEGVAALKVLAKQVALFKTESELLIIDAGNTGFVTEEELENYIGDLIESVPTLTKMDRDFHPFYRCGALRHLMWVLDKTGRGRIKIAELMASGLMDEWLDVQLNPAEIPRNWFSASISQQLYEKFVMLDRRGDGMLELADMLHYKQGIPPVIDDGLPRDVSPFSELFLERVFETTATYSGELDYKKFVDFTVAVEFLPQCHRPLFFWNIFDLHNDGYVTPVIINYFFRQTHAKLVLAGVSPPPMDLVVQELFDVIPTAQPLVLTKEEFVSASQAGLLSALIINCLSFWTYETREGK